MYENRKSTQAMQLHRKSSKWGVGARGRDARREGKLFWFYFCSHKFPRDVHQALKRFPKFPMCSLKCSNNFIP